METPLYRVLPSLDRVLRDASCAELIERYGRSETVHVLRAVLGDLRQRLEQEPELPPEAGLAPIVATAARHLEERHRPPLRRVFNLTGTIIHTNLGRAPLPDEAVAAMRAAAGAVDLEFDVEAGRRGDRDSHLEPLLCELTGAEAATVVNNNAAAVLLALAALAKDREVLVSRGELIEIGGSFRMPDVMGEAGCVLREVGTTNRTHVKDYSGALSAETGALMKVHRSNFTIDGFTAEPDERALASLAHDHDLPFIVDLGSGSLIELSDHGLPHEPTVAGTLKTGADVVTFSGDKLLGGPQAGLIVGARRWIEPIRRHPLKRALRADKLILAALAATLQLYRDPACLAARLPVLRLLTRHPAEIAATAERLRPAVQAWAGDAAQVSVVPCESQFGSGAKPGDRVPSSALRITPTRPEALSETGIAARLRRLPIPVVARTEKQAVLLDLRCLEDDATFMQQLAQHPLQP